MRYFEKVAESNYLMDFVGGADPTGRATLELSKKNDKHHVVHRIMSDAGGFIAGSALTTALTGGGLMGIGKLMKGDIGKNLYDSGKNSFIILNPIKAYKAIKQFGKAYPHVKNDMNLLQSMRGTEKGIPSAEEAAGLVNKYFKNEQAVKEYTKTYGNTPMKDSEKGVAAIVGAASAGIGGGLNTLSSESQYAVGQDMKKLERKAKDNGDK